MSHYTTPHKYVKSTRQGGKKISLNRVFVVVFNKTIIPLALVGYEMIIANLALRVDRWYILYILVMQCFRVVYREISHE